MAVENGRRVPRAAHPARPDIEVTRANETMIRSVWCSWGRRCELRNGAQNEAGAPSLPARAEKRSGGDPVVTGR